MTTINTLETYNLHAYSVESSLFAPKVSPIVNQFSGDELKSVLPHSVLLENGTGKNIWSITVLYTFPDEIAASGQAKRYIVTHTAPIRTSDDRMLHTGDQILITPVRKLTILHRSNQLPKQGQRIPLSLSMEAASYKHNNIDSGKRVQISVDSVVFEDGEVIGPDAAAKMEVFNERLDADLHLVDTVGGFARTCPKGFSASNRVATRCD